MSNIIGNDLACANFNIMFDKKYLTLTKCQNKIDEKQWIKM